MLINSVPQILHPKHCITNTASCIPDPRSQQREVSCCPFCSWGRMTCLKSPRSSCRARRSRVELCPAMQIQAVHTSCSHAGTLVRDWEAPIATRSSDPLKKAPSFGVLLLSRYTCAVLCAGSCPRPLCDINLHHICSPNNLRTNKEGKQRAQLLSIELMGFSWILGKSFVQPSSGFRPQRCEQAKEPRALWCECKGPSRGHTPAAAQVMGFEM